MSHNQMKRLVFMLTLGLLLPTLLAGAFRKGPYLIFTGVNTEMKVLWQLSAAETCTLAWGTDTAYSLGQALVTEYGNDHQYAYSITALIPGKKYLYRVKSLTETKTGTFRAAPPTDAKSLKFFAYGDTRSNPGTHNGLANAMVSTFLRDSSFQTLAVVVGDLVSNGDSESSWSTEFFNYSYPGIMNLIANIPYQACMGNHEGSGTLFCKYWPYPFVSARYYSFDYGPAHFTVLDQYTGYTPGTAQYNWMQNDLATSTKRWKFIVLHEPGWSAGSHANNTNVQNYIQPLCEQYGITAVFAGHNHYYARAMVNGIPHLTVGGGGAPLYLVNLTNPNIVAAASLDHYSTTEINRNMLNFAAYTANGMIIDQFSINRLGIYPRETLLSAVFIPAGTQGLRFSTGILNPVGHNLTPFMLLINSSGEIVDSVELKDDGLNGDIQAGDSLFSTLIPAQPNEDEFVIDLGLADHDSADFYRYPNQARFTTIGPLKAERLYFFGSDTIPNPGNRLRAKLILKNYSLQATAKNLSANIIPLDTMSSIYLTANPTFSDIAAGSKGTMIGFYQINFNNNAPDSAITRFRVEIASKNCIFWYDTIAVRIVKEQVSVDRASKIFPQAFELRQNYPNPFNASTTISYFLPVESGVELNIYNLQGVKIKTLIAERQPAGYHEYVVTTGDLVSGVYFYELKTGRRQQVRKMVLLK